MSKFVSLHGFGGGSSNTETNGYTLFLTGVSNPGTEVTLSNGKDSYTKNTDESYNVVFDSLESGIWTATFIDGETSTSIDIDVSQDMIYKFTTIPSFTYDGDYFVVNDNDQPIDAPSKNWKIKFLTSGTLKFTQLNGAETGIDVFVVGGGGGAATGRWADGRFRWVATGGGAYSNMAQVIPIENVEYYISIGAGGAGALFNNVDGFGSDGGSSSAFGISANGGEGAFSSAGSGPVSRSDRSVHEFYDSNNSNIYGAAIGAVMATANTGNGGSGTSNTTYSGGSGIVIIRNKRG